jgi:hypothetical protein
MFKFLMPKCPALQLYINGNDDNPLAPATIVPAADDVEAIG